ncbi:Bug family tripartite tricarboxylate transporter substrate binding protein [Vibrio aestuarianus]|nr:tripartite tricarboxylate transporter substrate-binding protein [Vibrio aestuarianus]MDE1255323.1 tripartite tricarboxylate transporter substrate binding protein [Vibrio aestuarianus]MDH6002888.1 tripartite tricarboxylate transporter substrate binding protein [Vibrio aestuarianus]WDS54690.1 tripartite tricarboxylate transporter substrate binding protein [Vibrio aestuarianus]WDS58401.1 tripartite tricarboxylate transporter substrate binding protein [Vibrio aestuarianus]
MKLKSLMIGAAITSIAVLPLTSVAGEDYPPKTLSFVAPSGAGGGWDLTIRTVAKTLKDTGLVEANMPITNRPGGGGAVNLAYMQTQKGSDKLISVYSPPILLTYLTGSSKYSYEDTTPLARLITDYGAFVVSKDSKYTSINEVMEALKKDPKSVKVGGTSAAGSMDHIQFLLIAKAAGVPNLNQIDYISFQDGGAVAQVLGGHVDLISTGLGDVAQLVESGNLRALAQTASKRVGEGEVAKIPTVREQGIDATFENWRGLFAPKDMPEYAVTYWNTTLKEMVETPEWEEARKRNGWDAAYQNGEDFTKFLAQTNEQYKDILAEIFKR